MFQVSSAGLRAPLSLSTIQAAQLRESMLANLSGQFIYVASTRNHTISEFVIDTATGVLRRNNPASGTSNAGFKRNSVGR